MSINLRLPNITGLSEREQISQIRSYLYQLVPELQLALSDKGASSDVVVASSGKETKSSSNTNFNVTGLFTTLKPLIIKSADIVDAYYDKISKKLEGAYVAQSDFGTFTESTAQAIQENSVEIAQVFTNIQTIDTNLSSEVSGIKQDVEDATKELSDSISKTESELSESINGISTQIEALAQSVDAILTVDAYIKSGLLYYNDAGLPIYGVEVGQTNNVNGENVFKKFARFISDRLSFYDQNDTEVAYISDYKLYITSVEILYSLVGGGFKLDFSRGFTLKYAGGE